MCLVTFLSTIFCETFAFSLFITFFLLPLKQHCLLSMQSKVHDSFVHKLKSQACDASLFVCKIDCIAALKIKALQSLRRDNIASLTAQTCQKVVSNCLRPSQAISNIFIWGSSQTDKTKKKQNCQYFTYNRFIPFADRRFLWP